MRPVWKFFGVRSNSCATAAEFERYALVSFVASELGNTMSADGTADDPALRYRRLAAAAREQAALAADHRTCVVLLRAASVWEFLAMLTERDGSGRDIIRWPPPPGHA
jgi:hypothetical protein